MLQRIAATIGAGADVARAEAELARRNGLRVGLAVAAMTACAGLAGASVLALAAAGVLTLAPATGLAGALAIVGAVLLLASGGATWAILARTGAATEADIDEARRRAEAARRLLNEKASPDEHDAPPNPAADAARAAASHPEVLAGAAFAASSILGARRTLRVARVLAGAAGAAGSSSLLSGVLSRMTGPSNGAANRNG